MAVRGEIPIRWAAPENMAEVVDGPTGRRPRVADEYGGMSPGWLDAL